MPRRVTGRRLLVASAAALGLAAVILLLFHTGPARGAATRRLVSALRAAGIDAAIGTLDYNLLTLRATARDVTLTATGSAMPFFAADAVRVRLDPSILSGHLRLAELDLSGARLTLRRDAGGPFNLPSPSTDAAPAGETVLPIDRLGVDGLDIAITDESLGWSASIGNLSATLHPEGASSAGTIEARGPVSLTWDGHPVDVDRLAASVSFDGRDLDIEGLLLDAADVRLEASGRLARVLNEPDADLTVTVSVNLARLSSLLRLDPAVTGNASFSGTTRGPLARPSIDGRVSVDGASWRTLHDVRARATLALAGNRLDLPSLDVDVAGGRAEGSASLVFDDGGDETRVDVRFDSVLLDPLADLVSGTPAPVGGRASGTVGVRWTDAGWQTAEIRLDATTSPRGSSRPLGLDGRLSLTAAQGAWRASARQRIAGSIDADVTGSGAMNSTTFADATLRGRLSLSVADLGRALDRLGDASIVSRSVADRIEGRLVADLVLGGTVGRPLLSGPVNVEQARYGDVGPATASGRLQASVDRIALDTIDVSSPQANGSGAMSVGLARDTLDGTFEIAVSSLDAWLPDTAPVRIASPVRTTVALAGSAGSPRIDADIRSGRIVAVGQPFDDVSGNVRFAGGTVTVEGVRLAQDTASVEGSGTYGIESGRFDVTVRARDLSLRPLAIGGADPIPVGGTIDLDFAGRGTATRPEGKGHVAVADLVYDERRLGALAADLTMTEGRARIEAVAPDLPARLDARVTLEPPYAFTAEAAIDDADVSALAERLARDVAQVVSGRLSASATASGTLDDPAAATADVTVRRLETEVRGIPVSAETPARLHYEAGAIATPGVVIQVGGGRMTVTGMFGEPGRTLAVDATGDLSELAPTIAAFAPDAPALEGSGGVTAHLEVGGSVERASVIGHLEATGARVGMTGQPLVEVEALRVRLADGALMLEDLRAGWLGARVAARGRVPLRLFAERLPAALAASLPAEMEAASLEARLENLTQAVLAPYVSAAALAELDLLVGADIRLEAAGPSAEQVRATVSVEPATVTVAGVTLGQRAPTTLAIGDGLLTVRDWEWRGQRTSLAVNGTVGLTGDHPLNLGVGGEVDLRLLSAFVPAAVAGEARFVAGLSGAAGDPDIAGEIELRDGEFRIADPRLVVGGLEGTVRLSQHRILAPELTGTANGGPLRLAVDLSHEWLVPTRGRVTVEATGVALEPIEGLRTELDSAVALELTDGDSRLTGSVTVVRGAYREPLTILGQILQRAGGLQAPAADAADRTFLERLSLEVTLATREDLIVDNNIADLAVGLDLAVVGTGATPSLVGRAAVREGGTLFLAGNVFRIEAGTIDFANATRIEPDLSISASTRVRGDDISLVVSGTPDTLRVDLSSTGTYSQTDIVSLLVTGETEGALGVEVARDQALGFLTGEFLAVAGHAVGLDVVRFERGEAGQSYRFDPGLVATETDPTSRFTVGKNLRRDLQLVYSQSLRKSGTSTWIVSYKPFGNVEVRGVVRDNRDRSYEFRHDLSFGGAARANRARARRTASRVGEERFAGSTGFPIDQLARLTKLDPGDRFDFYAWQADRERLERLYHDAGYREVQIRPSRTLRRPPVGPRSSASGPGDVVDLEYAITRGPLTVITATGYDLPAPLRRSLEALWSRAVVDAFFVEEAERTVRRHLAGAGHLQTQVRGALSTDADGGRKNLDVSVDAGPRTRDRVVNAAGNSGMSSGRIEKMASSPRDWLEPEVIARRIADAYRQEGWLDAVVAIGPPQFEGPLARLDVRVNEGVQYAVGPVRIDGAITRPPAEIEAALGLEPGTVYTPSGTASARARLEADYRRLGFNAVRIQLGTELDPKAASALVRLTVEEGPQQVVAGVTVDGVERTAPSLISRALSIEAGAPVDLSALYRSRQRLFATGVFRRVDLDLEPAGEPAAAEGGRVTQPVDVRAAIEEWPAYRLRYGLGLNDEKGIDNPDARTQTIGIVGELTRRNLFGRAISLGVAGRLERRQRNGRVFGSVPTLFGAPIASQVYVSWLRNKLGEGTTRPAIRNVTSVSFEQRIRPWEDATVSYAYNFERNHTFREDPDPDDPFGDFKVDIARLTAALTLEKRDDPLNARRGWFHSSTFEYSAERLGSQLRFAKYFGTLNGYLPLGRNIVLASGSRLGIADAFDQVLIPSERFFAGGGTSVRGYAEDAIGPSDYFGPLGGNVLLVFNEEVRAPLWWILGGVAFFDAGGVFESASELSFRDLDASVGVGLRIDTPFGLFRLDYGVPLSREPDDPAGRWFFSIGQLF